ncbi:LLM class flavin-dependent oxidoreductase [Kitasatospora herbaricolor]|uniref:LLM class flavin-dependent oxidoreductase n=1 Tax=Kitasatospora herbaricolor TaxID=68217 RepID=A0ABZ1W4V8_9ACTN|nr:LLM class flavin-dependent oxidoreductase [Kitasatospora herbaricolor]
MRFTVSSLVSNGPDPVSGVWRTPHEKLHNVIDQAVTAEQLGYEGYGVGERHGEPFLSPAPPVLLSAIAARTSTIRLCTTVTVLSILDPVRVAEDYAMLDQLSGGRLELIIGKGRGRPGDPQGDPGPAGSLRPCPGEGAEGRRRGLTPGQNVTYASPGACRGGSDGRCTWAKHPGGGRSAACARPAPGRGRRGAAHGPTGARPPGRVAARPYTR